MKPTITTLAACIALSALMLTGTACTDHDDLRTPAGTQLLALGEVTVAGTDVATTRSAATTGSTTRATQDPSTGFTDIRKTGFVDGDELTLTLSNVPGSSTPVTVTATMGAGNTWTLNPAKVYYAPATTTLTATYTPATQPGSEAAGTTGGIKYADVLTAATPISLAADGKKLSLTLTHANAMLEVTPPAGTTYTDLTISATTPTGGSGSNTPQDLGYFTQGSTATGDLRLLTIAPASATAPTISLKVNGITYTTTLTLSVEANKRYPITLKIVGDDLIATLATPTLNWGTNTDFEGIPTGYTHYIRTIEDLVAFRDAVNSTTTSTVTQTWTVLQMADIDLSGIDNWMPIGKTNHYFMGSYNGNGHTVSGMKINASTGGHVGLFGYIKEANITGVHVRNCSITCGGNNDIRAGALIGFIDIGSVITLCSATGTVEASGTTGLQIGGLIGRIYNESSTTTYVSRCSANVDVTMNATSVDAYCGAFTGYSMTTYFASCIASGKVTKVGTYGTFSGFSNFTATAGKVGSNHYNCITNSDLTNAGASRTAFGVVANIRSCLATWTGYTHFYTTATGGISANVCLAQIIDQTDVSDGIVASDAHAILVSNKIGAGITTLHYSPEDGYTLTPVTRAWYAVDAWQNNTSALPTLRMSYEGMPAAINSGNTIYRVNGYFVTAPETETKTYAWAETQIPCASAAATSKGWRMPTMKDFEVMAGWSIINPWSQDEKVLDPICELSSTDYAAAFPELLYPSSDINTKDPTQVWSILSFDKEGYYAFHESHASPCQVRCVQKIAP